MPIRGPSRFTHLSHTVRQSTRGLKQTKSKRRWAEADSPAMPIVSVTLLRRRGLRA
jgi:hypothetical protein